MTTMALAQLVSQTWLRTVQRTMIVSFLCQPDSVGVFPDLFILPVQVKQGILLTVRVSSASSSSFDISLYNRADGVAGSVDEIVRTTNITTFDQDTQEEIYFISKDVPRTGNLYLAISNDSVSEVDDITVELIIIALD